MARTAEELEARVAGLEAQGERLCLAAILPVTAFLRIDRVAPDAQPRTDLPRPWTKPGASFAPWPDL